MRLVIKKEVKAIDMIEDDMFPEIEGIDTDLFASAKEAVRNGQAELTVKEKSEIKSEEVIDHYRHGSAYMFFQLVETTPKAKMSFVKNYRIHKEKIIKDLDGAIEFEPYSQILERTPDYAKEETKAVVSIVSLAINEVSGTISGDMYRNMIYDAFPALRNIVVRHKNKVREIERVKELYEQILSMEDKERMEIDATSKEAKTLMRLIESEEPNPFAAIQKEMKKIKPFTYKDIQSEAKKIDNLHSRKRRRRLKDTDTDVSYRKDELYLIGALHFAEYYLELLPDAVYEFGSLDETLAYFACMSHYYQIHAPANTVGRIRTTKAKDRPVRIQNNDSIGDLLEFEIGRDNFEVWSEYIAQLYNLIEKRADIFLNEPIVKNDIDKVAQLVLKWNKHNGRIEDEKMSKEQQEQFFVLGLILVVYERLLEKKPSETEETVIRMDTQRKEQFEKELAKKEEEIKRLNARIEQLNSSLSQNDAIRRENKALKEQLAWQEERANQEVASELREESSEEIQENIDIEYIKERLNSSEVCVLGGDLNWQQSLKEDLPNVTFQLAEEVSRSMNHVVRAKLIVYNTATMNHGIFYRFKQHLKKNQNDPIVIYINSQSSNKELTYQKIGQRLQMKRSDN